MTIRRYSIQGWCDVPGAVREDEQGEWVKFEDFKKLARAHADLRAEIAEDIEELRKLNHRHTS